MAISSHALLGLATGCRNPGVFPGNHFMDVHIGDIDFFSLGHRNFLFAKWRDFTNPKLPASFKLWLLCRIWVFWLAGTYSLPRFHSRSSLIVRLVLWSLNHSSSSGLLHCQLLGGDNGVNCFLSGIFVLGHLREHIKQENYYCLISIKGELELIKVLSPSHLLTGQLPCSVPFTSLLSRMAPTVISLASAYITNGSSKFRCLRAFSSAKSIWVFRKPLGIP